MPDQSCTRRNQRFFRDLAHALPQARSLNLPDSPTEASQETCENVHGRGVQSNANIVSTIVKRRVRARRQVAEDPMGVRPADLEIGMPRATRGLRSHRDWRPRTLRHHAPPIA